MGRVAPTLYMHELKTIDTLPTESLNGSQVTLGRRVSTVSFIEKLTEVEWPHRYINATVGKLWGLTIKCELQGVRAEPTYFVNYTNCLSNVFNSLD